MNENRLDTRELDRIAAQVGMKRDRVLEAFAFEIQREAQINAPVLTGTLRSSIHTRTKHGGGMTGPMPANVASEELPAPTGNIIAVVGSGVEYAVYPELGTSRMAAQPYLGPAVEHNAARLNDGTMFKELFE